MAGSLSANFNCNTYYDYLFDRSPHFDDDILKDWFPTDDAWIGQVQTLSWDAFTGTQHVYDRIHVGAPDMSQTWAQFETTEGNFIGYQDGLGWVHIVEGSASNVVGLPLELLAKMLSA